MLVSSILSLLGNGSIGYTRYPKDPKRKLWVQTMSVSCKVVKHFILLGTPLVFLRFNDETNTYNSHDKICVIVVVAF